MKTWSFETKVKLIGILLGIGVVIHLSLGMFEAILERRHEPRRTRFQPRHAIETVIRGKTFHTHPKTPVDLQVKDNYEKRRYRVETFRPHFVARREILEHDYDESEYKEKMSSTPSMYKMAGGETIRLGTKCGRCAVVGSAGTLTLARSGQQIDNSDCVFRLGLAPVDGFSNDTGTKTTFRIVDGKSFGEILRWPDKLAKGSVSSNTWIVFDHFDVEAMSKLVFKMPRIKRTNPSTKILTVTRKAEVDAHISMKQQGAKLGYAMPNKNPSTLWFTMQAVKEAGCQNVDVYGIPDPKFCKTCSNGQTVKSRYWGKGSPSFCTQGKDCGSESNTAQQQLVSLSDRRALLALATINNPITFSFNAPHWPQVKYIQ